MAALVGLLLAVVVAVFAAKTRLDRDGAFYPVVVIVVAAYYVLFAAMTGSIRVISIETAIAGAFVVATLVGFKRSTWLVALALGGHGVLDLFHSRLVANPGVPVWWPAFCSTYDLAAAAAMSWLLTRGKLALVTGSTSTLSENLS